MALLIEVIAFNVIGLAVFPTYFWLDIAILFLITAVIFILPSFTMQAIVIMVLLSLQALVSVANESLYNMSGFVFDLNMLNLLYEVGGVFDNDFINLIFLVFLCFLLIAEGAVLFGMRKFKAGGQFRLQSVVMLLFVFCFASGLSVTTYFVQAETFATASVNDELYLYKDDANLYDTQFLGAKAYRKFGTFGFYYKNIGNFINDEPIATDENEGERYTQLSEFLADGTLSSSLEDLDLTEYGGNANIKTGSLKGQNIVLIVIESGEWYAINSMYTPTLYALANQGIALTQYYARDKTNHSEAISVLGSYPSELTNSIAPSISNPDGLLDHNFAFTLPNILQQDGYATNYFHANSGEFYKRGNTFADLYGFDYQTFKTDMDRIARYDEPADVYHLLRDSDVITQYLSEFTKKDTSDSAFFTMMMTITSHGGYDELIDLGDYSAAMSESEKAEFTEKCSLHGMELYYERIEDFPSSESFIEGTMDYIPEKYDEEGDLSEIYLRYKRYQATIMDLDVGINRLIHELQSSGELKNTTFVFYSDHSAYYSEQNYAMKGIQKGAQWDTSLYNIPFFFWSGSCMDLSVDTELYTGIQYEGGSYYYDVSHNSAGESCGGLKITKFCNSFDILPTLLDLLGYDFNGNLYQGVSVLDAQESVFVSRESGLFNSYIYTDGDYVYLKAVEQGSAIVSADGEIRFAGDTVTIQSAEGLKNFDADEIKQYLYNENGYIVYNLDAVLTDEEQTNMDNRAMLSESVNAFLKATTAYYEKQNYLEIMYAIDYFKTADISDYVFSIQ